MTTSKRVAALLKQIEALNAEERRTFLNELRAVVEAETPRHLSPSKAQA